MNEKIKPLSEREKEIKRIEYRKKASEKRDEMIVPLEIRMLAGLPYVILLIFILLFSSYVEEYAPLISMLLRILLVFIIFFHTFIRYLFKGVGIVPYLFGMSYVDLESGYLVDRGQMWELIKKEYYYRLTLTSFKHVLDLLEGPYYRTIAMKEYDYVVAYRKQAYILRYYLNTIKNELS